MMSSELFCGPCDVEDFLFTHMRAKDLQSNGEGATGLGCYAAAGDADATDAGKVG